MSHLRVFVHSSLTPSPKPLQSPSDNARPPNVQCRHCSSSVSPADSSYRRRLDSSPQNLYPGVTAKPNIAHLRFSRSANHSHCFVIIDRRRQARPLFRTSAPPEFLIDMSENLRIRDITFGGNRHVGGDL